MDTGDMLLKASVPIPPEQTSSELAEILAPLGAELLAETLIKLQTNEITPIPQHEPLATYAPLLKKQDFHLDWTRSAQHLHNQIRAFFPQCFTGFQPSPDSDLIRLRILTSDPPQELDSTSQGSRTCTAQPGEVIRIEKGTGFQVQTGSGELGITQVQLSGKKAQSAWDFVNGVRLEPGQRFWPLDTES